MELGLLLAVIVTALLFEYINGFHDTANAIATVVSTKVLSPRTAVVFASVLNLAGAFAGTHVAKTIGGGMVDAAAVTQTVILAALLGAIIWNLLTWYFGIPSSSSHALIGGLVGAAWARSGYATINVQGVMSKVIVPMISSPIMGLLAGFLAMLLILWLCRKMVPEKVNRHFRKLQLVSSGIMAFGHGSNDAQKTMGIITLALLSAGKIPSMNVPVWVIASCALVMGAGTLAGGWKIVQTMGSKVIKLRPVHGFAAETSAATVILTASHFGIPVSTTHIISTSIMGVGSTRGVSAVRWGLVGSIVQVWVFTIPVCAILGAAIYKLLLFWLVG